jgi:hypothetical protein
LGFPQELAQPGNLLRVKIMRVRPLEKCPLVADAEQKLIVSVRFNRTKMLDQFHSLAPTEVMGEFAAEKIMMQRFKVLAHLASLLMKVRCGIAPPG